MTPRRCEVTGKVRFRERAFAEEIVVYLRAKRDEPLRRSRRLTTWHCGSCGDFHIGHLSIAAYKARRIPERLASA